MSSDTIASKAFAVSRRRGSPTVRAGSFRLGAP